MTSVKCCYGDSRLEAVLIANTLCLRLKKPVRYCGIRNYTWLLHLLHYLFSSLRGSTNITNRENYRTHLCIYMRGDMMQMKQGEWKWYRFKFMIELSGSISELISYCTCKITMLHSLCWRPTNPFDNELAERISSSLFLASRGTQFLNKVFCCGSWKQSGKLCRLCKKNWMTFGFVWLKKYCSLSFKIFRNIDRTN